MDYSDILYADDSDMHRDMKEGISITDDSAMKTV